MKKVLLVMVIGACAVALALVLYRSPGDIPSIAFAKVTRETISNTISTNGKIEPIEYAEVRVDTSGLVRLLPVHLGQAVVKGQLLTALSQPGVAEELASADARAAQAAADLSTLQAGGRSGEIAEIDGNLNRLKAQREAAQHNQESLDRLVTANAATRFEADQARQSVLDLDAQMQTLQQRRASLVGKGDIAGAEARVREADASVQLAKTHGAQNSVYAPLGGTVYDLPIRLGAYVHAGDAIASVGKLDPLRVRVYVDEPELGRVAEGEQVRITWDALPAKEWHGTVEKRPSAVVALGTRQVGEVLCTIENPGRELLPGTNVNAFILAQLVPNAITIPKTALRQQNGTGVYVLQRETGSVRWQPVKTGVSDVLRVEVTNGLKEGDMVAQSTDHTLADGARVIALP